MEAAEERASEKGRKDGQREIEIERERGAKGEDKERAVRGRVHGACTVIQMILLDPPRRCITYAQARARGHIRVTSESAFRKSVRASGRCASVAQSRKNARPAWERAPTRGKGGGGECRVRVGACAAVGRVNGARTACALGVRGRQRARARMRRE